jgi:hypothetical protein
MSYNWSWVAYIYILSCHQRQENELIAYGVLYSVLVPLP